MREPAVLRSPVEQSAGRRRPAARRSHSIEWLLVLLALAAMLLAGAAIVLLSGERGFFDRIYPNIAVRGEDLGGKDRNTAYEALIRRYGPFLSSPIELVYGERTWRPGADDLGLQLDFAGAIDQAQIIGRTGSRSENLRTIKAVWDSGVDLPLHATVDQTLIQRYLLQVARAVEQPPRNADLALAGSRIIVTAESWGTQVLIDETLQDITAALQRLEPVRIDLRTRRLEPTVRDSDIAPTVVRLQTILAAPLELRSSDGRRWQWTLDRIAGWLSLRPTQQNGRPAMELQIDYTAIRNALVPIAAALKEEGALPRVAWNDGLLSIITPGTPGSGLDANRALGLIDAALGGGSRIIILPRKAIPPPVTEANLAGLGIVEPVGVGISSFARSEQYRITNIRAGARRMHGLLLPPGSSFSFNDNLGAVNAENGFVEGLAIVDNRTQKEWGGGLCQVSTTVFRAAFWGGLPITERHEHSFRIGWYEELGEPPGLDAAIFTGVQDLRFVNNTGGWLLMQSSVDLQRQRLTVALYGAPANRRVELDYRILERIPQPREPLYVDDPELPAGTVRKTDMARAGLKVEVYRLVREQGRIIARDTFATEFKPWPDIYVRGTGPR